MPFQTTFYKGVKGLRIGQYYGNGVEIDGYINTADDVSKVAVLTLSTASGNQVVTIGGIIITTPYNTSDTLTAADIVKNINGSYVASTGIGAGAGVSLRSRVVASSSAGVVTITGLIKGDDFPITYSGTGGTLTVDGTGGSRLATISSYLEVGRIIAINANDAIVSSANVPSVYPCRYPKASGDKILGLAVNNSNLLEGYEGSDIPGFKQGSVVPVLRRGVGVALLDDSTATIRPGDPLYYRHTVNGSLNKLGAVHNASGTGLAAITNATFNSAKYSMDGFYLAEIRLV